MEITHNILRNVEQIDLNDTIEKVFNDDRITNLESTYILPRDKNYIKSLQGMSLIMEDFLKRRCSEDFDFEKIEKDNKEFGKLARNLIRITTTPIPSNEKPYSK